ncbi:MAG TPA: ABC transporter substrate-binding protein [Acidimicrobiia bacterium]|nr:ABC transporter substrate-binding protein [Acidimicrobiia bacterium]
MRCTRTVVCGVALAITLSVATTPVAAQSATGDKPKATELGVTAKEIRIAVIADDENQLAPGLFHAVPVAVEAFAKYINFTGGVAGRKLVVDVIDFHLSADDARNAIIQACENDFAIVGTSALFLSNVDDAVSCADKTGAATGIPDLAVFTTETVHQCSSVTFGINPPQLDCATRDASPQTYRANQGADKYYLRKINKNLHGVFIYGNDLKASTVGGLGLARGIQAAGIKSDVEIGVSARATQAAYTPIVQQMKDADANYAYNASTLSAMVALRKEAKLQGLNADDVLWDCTTTCYDRAFLEQGGADVEGVYGWLGFLPFEEAKRNEALANYLKFTGVDNATGFGAYAWVAGLLFRDSVNAIVERDGVNGLTRAEMLSQLENTHAFDGDGMWGTTDIGNHKPTPCFMLYTVKNGKFTRAYPKKPGTFDCKKSNAIKVEADLLGG